MSTKDLVSEYYRFAGLLTGVVFNSDDDIEYNTYSLHNVNKPLNVDNDNENINTLASKFLGPVITNRENCRVCLQSPINCPGHCGVIRGLPIMAAPGRDDLIFEMIKHICVICFSVSTSDRCNCGADLPTTRKGQPGQFTIHIGDNRAISLDSWTDVYGYITQLTPKNISKLIKIVYPKSSPGFGINNLFTRIIIVPPNIMRPETPVKGQNKMMPSIDTKNLNAIVSQLMNDNRGIGVGESSKLISAIYNYYSLEAQQQPSSLGLFDINTDEGKSSFVDMLTKYGFLRRYAIGKITFGIGRMVNTSGNMLPLTTIGLNANAGRQYQVRHVVNKTNIRALMIMLSFRKIREMATIIKRDGRIFKGTSQFKFDYLPSFGDTIYLPAKKKILVVNRQPTKGRRSMLAMIADVLGLSTGAYLNSLVADLLDGDYDGDELSISKLRERASELGVYITMSVAGLLYSDRLPGVEFGLIDEAIIGIAKLSLTRTKFNRAEFFGLFLKTTLPFFYVDKEYYTGGDVITSILYDTKLTYKIRAYNEDSIEYVKFGDEHMNIEIVDGVYKNGLIADLAVGRNSKSIFSKLSFLVNPYKVLEKISMFYWIGIAASSLFGNSFAINQLVSSERNYNLLKASKNITMQKVQSMIDAYQFKTSISDISLIQLLEQIAIPNPKYLGLYNKNLAVPSYSEFNSNDLELSNMCGLGPNSKQINAYVGYGYMNIINGGVSSESLLYGRMAPSERIGDHKAIPLGFVEGNISLGYTAEDQFKQRSLAATAFSTKVILVSKPGAQLNNSKMFFESMIISPLDEIKYNGITIQRFGGRCNLIPGKCAYFSVKNLINVELTISDFYNDRWLFDKYLQLKKSAQKKINASAGFDIFDLNTTELVFWDKDITLKMANEGDLRLAYPGGGVIDVTKKIQFNNVLLIKLYTSFVNSLYNLTGTNGSIWKSHIELIILYFLTTTPPTIFEDIRKLAIYLRSIKECFYSKTLQYGASIGDHMVEACLSNYIQESLDAHKKPEVKRKDNELKSILGPRLAPNEIEMIIFMKDGTSIDTTQLIAKNMIEIRLKDILVSDSMELSLDINEIEHAIKAYSESMKKMVKICAFFKLKFDKRQMYKEGITAPMIYSSLTAELSYHSFPLAISNFGIEFIIEVPDVNQAQQQFEIVKNVKVGGVSGILNAKVITNGDINYIATLGCNILEILKIPHVDRDKLLVSDADVMKEYFGLSGAIIGQSLMSSLKIRGVHFSYLNILATARHCTGTALTVSRNGVSKSPRSILREIASGHPYQNTTTAAANAAVDDGVIHSTVKSTLMGQAPMVASNYSTACIDLRELGKVTAVQKNKLTTDYIMNLFNEK